MEKRGLKSNYIITFINSFLFLLLFCVIYTLTRCFIKALKTNEEIKLWVLFFGLASPFIFYTFFANLNGIYEKIQSFFFKHTFLNLIIPSLLIVLALGYFFIPKIFSFSFNLHIFLFLGSIAFSLHFIFVAYQLKSSTFSGFINYLFILSMIYIFCLVIFGIYLLIGYSFPLKEILGEGIKEGFSLIKSIVLQLFYK